MTESSKRMGGKYDVDAISLLNAKLDTLSQNFDLTNFNAVGTSCVACKICESSDYVAIEC